MPQPLYQRKKRKKKKIKRTPHAIFSRRITVLSGFFVAVCMVYAVILISLQAKGNAYSIYKEKPSVPAGYTVHTVTLQAVRGDIYDRNGKPLVTNVYAYDLVLHHDPFVTDQGIAVRNSSLLTLLSYLSTPEAGELTEDSFPLAGVYPNFTYNDEARDGDSMIAQRLDKLLSRLGLSQKTTAGALAQYYVKTYSLNAHLDGVPLYTGEEITKLIRLYYDMDLCRFGSDTTEYTLAKGVSASVLAANKESPLRGVEFIVRAERVYHYPGYASHILGRVGKIFAEDWEYYNSLGYPMNAIVGVAGCESAFESILHGVDGQMQIIKDNQGQTVSSTVIKQPIAGQDIRLTIDIDTQIAAEDSLRDQLQRTGLKKGAVIATDPNTGECLALASAPTFDATLFNENYDQLASDPASPLLNRALSGLYFPGKLMQLCTGTAGVGSGLVDSSTLWVDSGVLKIEGYTLLCPLLIQTDVAHGFINASTAIVDKCDIFFGKLAQGLGLERYASYESLLGFGQKTGIELSEEEGRASSIAKDNQAALIKAALGEGDTVCTPAQLCSMLSSIVSGGKRYSSHLLYEVRNFTSGDVTQKTQPSLLCEYALSGEGRTLLLDAMRDAMKQSGRLEGLVEDLNTLGIQAGCFASSVPSGNGGTDHAVMLAYSTPVVSLSNQLRTGICVAVIVENGGEASVAEPVIEAVLEQWNKE